uniref:Cytochrome c oxidase polypeptide II n=1 Tax=Tetrahymena thermophila TaxID=5911 RepID=Q950Y9_TETTH|nr:cytochrome c oxidase subunit 2 [Tetrahymena thermophila]7W5Z_C2 Chain C2, Cytochrome c oxidase subunit 2 [Tetrahymena thermophila]7W5Z_c2 Chain c2, Cytochrome c oxidase subunit 2 [Tetrahymena thermophila]8B6H_DB Chain DB, Cytochrome c oxidase subunit 2 [Tetrahymena thermophila SB210]8B6H_Db Chain Db, Cytochrome c oxidase subunit 2 [Tetrahymena thermophila SB210]8BQS_DB Chain DB, Cytochrome c oxidase subunit 2 [Tetrahymena thermophila SB210]8BQS_Db Chain Db, Cytochrome c oxidase subunit 2 [
MWGNLWTEASYQLNFNIGFSSLRSDVLIHLAQWQYWWWFWFALIWSFYYFIILKVARFRVLKMRPKISTSYRPHGKWGDFLACIIPLIWCINILTNSNLILRLIEWQNESSLFTVRVRARQWYWIYKFELKNFTDILSTPKNIGNNRWQINTFGELQTADDYLHVLQLRSQNKWVKNYWNRSLQETGKTNKAHVISPQEQLRLSLINQYKSLNLSSSIKHNAPFINRDLYVFDDLFSYNLGDITTKKSLFNDKNSFLTSYSYLNNNSWNNNEFDLIDNLPFTTLFDNNDLFNNYKSFFQDSIFNSPKKQLSSDSKQLFKHIIYRSIKNNIIQDYTKLVKHEDFDEYSRWIKRSPGEVLPLRIIKYPLGLETIHNNIFENTNNEGNVELFRLRFNSNSSKMQHKLVQDTIYLTLKQKRYNRKKVVAPQIKYYKDDNGNKTDLVKYTGKPYLSNDKLLKQSIYDQTTQYKLIKKNKKRGELIPVTLARRILRTKKTLVLPAHVNITLITNSYDIVHSWFIPGLGIKLDCVPGRSTHHTFFIDNVGFYYGQCAEICGRYHHHMPIRVCALPFEHFLLWWNTFGLPKMLNTVSRKRFETHYELRKYSW